MQSFRPARVSGGWRTRYCLYIIGMTTIEDAPTIGEMPWRCTRSFLRERLAWVIA